jgi:hypothetical protein
MIFRRRRAFAVFTEPLQSRPRARGSRKMVAQHSPAPRVSRAKDHPAGDFSTADDWPGDPYRRNSMKDEQQELETLDEEQLKQVVGGNGQKPPPPPRTGDPEPLPW